MDLKETEILGKDIDRHWYYTSKAKAMLRLLEDAVPDTVLDVGAGSGYFSKYLLAKTAARSAWCVDISYDADADDLEYGKPIRFRRSVEFVDADLALVMDLLEHVDDDIGLLREYAGKVPSGCRFLITVPAFEFLWSGHDDFLDHRRRYTLQRLEDAVGAAGLDVLHGSYYFGAVFPIAAGIRLAEKAIRREAPARSQLKKHNPIVNTVLSTMCRAELPVMKRNRLAGLSVICLAQKR
jgi:SAM-dependent methyltransferase